MDWSSQKGIEADLMTATVTILGREYPAYDGGDLPDDTVVYRGAVMDIDEMLGLEEKIYWDAWDATHEDDGRLME